MKHVMEWLDEAFKELFEERAGMREFCGGESREEAEKNAESDCRQEWAKRKVEA